ncbi:hypothetical protein D9M68_894550 [compost metagenome]
MPAIIFGRMRYPGALIPMISSASICSVTLIVPISEEMADPIFPANTIALMVGLSSRIVESRFTCPIIVFGIKSLTSWNAICNVITAPINVDIIAISPREPTPIKSIC